jgi:hypothetical protein
MYVQVRNTFVRLRMNSKKVREAEPVFSFRLRIKHPGPRDLSTEMT